MIDAYIALGGNEPNTLKIMRQVVTRLKGLEGIEDFTPSGLYRTSPVSPLAQPDYLNAACRFQTSLPVHNLWHTMKRLEQEMGKVPKSKESPRLIDIDLLFYGDLSVDSEDLTLPHPRLQERLFVLTPLADITDTVPTGAEIKDMMERCRALSSEKVTPINERL